MHFNVYKNVIVHRGFGYAFECKLTTLYVRDFNIREPVWCQEGLHEDKRLKSPITGVLGKIVDNLDEIDNMIYFFCSFIKDPIILNGKKIEFKKDDKFKGVSVYYESGTSIIILQLY